MTTEEILKLAREAGFQTGYVDYHDGNGQQHFIRPLAKENIMGDLLKFAAAMVLIEREACAKICDEHILMATNQDGAEWSKSCADVIRARKELTP